MLNQLPPDAQQPVLSVQVGQTIDAMYIGFSSEVLPANKITDYLIRVVQPKLQAVEGVQTAEILGAEAVRPARLARPEEARRLRPDRRRRANGAGRQRLPLGGGQHQGADGAGQPDRLDQPALRWTSSAT